MAPLLHEGLQSCLEECLFLVSCGVCNQLQLIHYSFPSKRQFQAHLPYPWHGRTLTHGSLFRYWACCDIRNQQWAKNLFPFHSNWWSGELRTPQPSGNVFNMWFTVLPPASLTLSCSVLSVSCHYPVCCSIKPQKQPSPKEYEAPSVTTDSPSSMELTAVSIPRLDMVMLLWWRGVTDLVFWTAE